MARLLVLGTSGCKFKSYHLEYCRVEKKYLDRLIIYSWWFDSILCYLLLFFCLLYTMENLNSILKNAINEAISKAFKEIEEECKRDIFKEKDNEDLVFWVKEILESLEKINKDIKELSTYITTKKRTLLELENVISDIKEKSNLKSPTRYIAKDIEEIEKKS